MTNGMEMSEQPRSRRQTRAAILGHLLQSGGMFRPPLAKAVRLSEASLSRILPNLERDGIVKSIKAKPGDSLAVDAVIMEFA